MPHATIKNETEFTINVAFFIVAPAFWRNSLNPGESWTCHLPSLPLRFQARKDTGTNQFNPEESWALGGTMAGGVAAGIAALAFGTQGWSVPAAAAMAAAHRAGNAVANWGDNVLIEIGAVWISFDQHKHKYYTVKRDQNEQHGLWDDKKQRFLS